MYVTRGSTPLVSVYLFQVYCEQGRRLDISALKCAFLFCITYTCTYSVAENILELSGQVDHGEPRASYGERGIPAPEMIGMFKSVIRITVNHPEER